MRWRPIKAYESDWRQFEHWATECAKGASRGGAEPQCSASSKAQLDVALPLVGASTETVSEIYAAAARKTV